MRLLVTGGAGYIGSVVAAQLLAAGHEVVVLDALSTGHADAVPEGARFVRASLLDAPVLAAVFADGFDGVLHFAAKLLVAESVAHPELYWRNNVIGTFELLEAMVAASVPRLVFSSTAAVYGEPDQVPILEIAPTRPTSAYGASKMAVDAMIGTFALAHGLAATSLRYFNVAGARGHLGERHATETHLIPIVLQVAEGRRAHVQVYGLGSSVREVIGAARRVTGRPIATVDAPRRQGDPAVLVASSARIGQELGWTPHKPALDGMVVDAWACLQGRGRQRV